MKQIKRCPVSSRALVQRINRVLAKGDEMLKKTRGARAQQELGDYFRLDINHNFIVEKNVPLETMGRELGVLAKWEQLADEDE